MNNKPSLNKKRVPASDGDPRIEQLAAQVARLSNEVHTLKGNLAANTSFTKELLEGQDAFKALLQKIDVEKVLEVIGAIDSMKGGMKVLGWLERPAKWIAAIAGAVVGVWALFKSQGG
jgi:hypothetical protein